MTSEHRLARIPGLRTLESSRFRVVIAVLLAVVGAALAFARLSSFDPTDTSVSLDFPAYFCAAERMLAGASPYVPMALAGAGCQMEYLYPPFLAQVLAPITPLPLGTAKLVWVLVTYAAAYASTWIAVGIGGARRSLEPAAWCLVAVLWFDAVASVAWVGNVGTLIALCVTLVAMGGAAAGIGAGLGALLKVIPGTLFPAVLLAGMESRTTLLLTLALVGGSLFLLAPDAWISYPAVVWQLFLNPDDSAVNLSLTHAAESMGLGSAAVTVVRVAMVAAASACVIASAWVARRRGGMPAASLLGTIAMLLIPGTLWYHYLAVLLPFGAMAWPRATLSVRWLLLASAVLISLMPYVNHLGALYLGIVRMLAAAGSVLWPRLGPSVWSPRDQLHAGP